MKNVIISRCDFIRKMEEIAESDPNTELDGIKETEDIKEFALNFQSNHPSMYAKQFLLDVCKFDESEIKSKRRKEYIDIISKYVEFMDEGDDNREPNYVVLNR